MNRRPLIAGPAAVVGQISSIGGTPPLYKKGRGGVILKGEGVAFNKRGKEGFFKKGGGCFFLGGGDEWG